MTDGGSEGVRPDSTRLLLDVMLGRLVPYLRVCGYNAAYAGDRGVEADDRLLDLAADEDRVLLTRDNQLAARADDAIRLSALDLADQLTELREAGVMLEPDAEPTRCGRCNGQLERVASDATTPPYAPDPAETRCWRCASCGQVFWQGSHWDRMVDALE